ncbi:hypothetical protein [Roseinatronobacter alkalisoli]|uniref:Uncharacterized protein n=1 Tax=Roseinatronobacter alkalisoli TaxID=3028235 RepID=A0ABT5TEC2_9RHOB|nr:hypothetical protein [Roseinatronobacter sp. HJB301]MDD7973448.1 hypothetical protein [Roseinatronobacter sp. HJB301]
MPTIADGFVTQAGFDALAEALTEGLGVPAFASIRILDANEDPIHTQSLDLSTEAADPAPGVVVEATTTFAAINVTDPVVWAELLGPANEVLARAEFTAPFPAEQALQIDIRNTFTPPEV